MTTSFNSMLQDVHNCTLCLDELPHGVRPVLKIHPDAKILIAGQAPGRIVHETGIPFNDKSGERLRQWMGVSEEEFYESHEIAILPMSFCYPGTGKSGDLPPCKKCAPHWREALLKLMPKIELTLVIGIYAQKWHLKDEMKTNLTETVKAWQDYAPELLPMPHPSPRNFHWMKKNPWFEQEIVPHLQDRIKKIIKKSNH